MFKKNKEKSISSTESPDQLGGKCKRKEKDETKPLPPLLLHFDVNKTVIQSDSIQMKTIEEGVREGISELFWGTTHKEGDKLVWNWTRSKPSCAPPENSGYLEPDGTLVNYSQYCKEVVKDRADRKEAVKSFKLVTDLYTREEMEKLTQLTMSRMQLRQDVKHSKQATDAGLKGSTLMMFPTIFHFTAALQRQRRTFGILFRSFGADHDKIKGEWNAFCEMRHPVYSHWLQGIGPLDGSVAGIPDRRIHGIHTLYRDSQGPVLIIDTFTNGPQDHPWDTWAKQKPKIKFDNRDGRNFIKKVLKAETVEGIPYIQKWMKQHLLKQGTAAIKDDWAWWQWNDEHASAAKLMTLIGNGFESKQLFYDDNIEHTNARIVDCRDEFGMPIPLSQSLNKIIVKVNPVEALLDDEYFLRKLQRCHGEHLDVGASLVEFQRQLTELEEQKDNYAKQVQALKMQLKNVTEENRSMKLVRKINVRDEAGLRDLLSKDHDLSQFGQGDTKSVTDLYKEIEQGHCWLEYNDQGRVIRVLEMLFMKIQYKDLILIESHKQDSSKHIQTCNHLPGITKSLRDLSFKQAINRFFESDMQVNIRNCVKDEVLPIFKPEAPDQQTGVTQAYPIPCKLQQSHATFSIAEEEVETHKELLSKIGLPGGKHFTSIEKELHGGTVTRFWRWDKLATWEATSARGGPTGATVSVSQTCNKLFKGHPRREVYENLLLQMFETFTAKKLCGGFSGSLVIRVQPFEPDGRPGEPCIVKLDTGDNIREEYRNSVNVFEALPDRAAKILGEAVYANKDDVLFGAFRMELAGACWNVPELAHGSANLLSTFKDLLMYESEQSLLGNTAVGAASDVRPFGNVHSVLAETFGPGGIVASLRKGGKGLHRAETPLLWGWYTLKGKETKFNPFTAKKGEYPPEAAMRKLYRRYFREDMPDLKELVLEKIKPQLEHLAREGCPEVCPLVGLAHGDLNAANIMIDALDAVWLIDFATSVDLPLFTDMCKFEMACFFEYAAIPITPKVLLDFASNHGEMWSSMNVGDWLRVDQDTASLLLRELVSRPPESFLTMLESDFDKIIEHVAEKSGRAPHKQRAIVRNLKARLCTHEMMMDNAFEYCGTITSALLQGTYLGETLDVRGASPPDGVGSNGAASLRFFMEHIITIRRFMLQDIMNCFREQQSAASLQPCDALSLQLWLPFLRESYRIVGYPDISPAQKIWAIHHCHTIAGNVLRTIELLRASWRNLRSLPAMQDLMRDIAARKRTARLSTSQSEFTETGGFTEAESHRIYAHRHIFSSTQSDKIVRKLHSTCSVYKERPGFYSAVYQVLTLANDRQVLLEFNTKATGTWELYVDDSHENVSESVWLGYVTPNQRENSTNGDGKLAIAASSRKDGPVATVVLRSRLFFLVSTVLQTKLSMITEALENPIKVSDSFSLNTWSGGIFRVDSAKHAEKAPRRSFSAGACGTRERRGSFSSMEPDGFFRSLTVRCVARDSEGNDKMSLILVLGSACCCYPPGTKLCIDSSAPTLGKTSSPEVVIMSLCSSGDYRIRDALEPTPETERDFDPEPGAHVMLAPMFYKVGQRVVFREDENTWADGDIAEQAIESTGYRYRVQVKGTRYMSPDELLGVPLTNGRGTQVEEEPLPKVLRHLNSMNSCISVIPALLFEEEVQKIKVYCRARHSYIIDALSGQRIDVKECAMPTLHIVKQASAGPCTDSERVAKASTVEVAGSAKSGRGIRANASFSASSLDFIPDARQGWSVITTAVDKYEKAIPTCLPNAFLVLGAPGSGKSCLVNRLIMDCLERQSNLVPILIPVQDLVKRMAQEADINELDSSVVHAWFDKYLRITFGEDSQRYRMICQAVRMHRAMFLFEGLEDAAGQGPVIERCIQDRIMERHLVIVTSRPILLGSEACSLADVSDKLRTMRLQNVTDQQKRSIAHSRLGPEGLGAYDKFFLHYREGFSLMKAELDSEEPKDEQDVFGNPMMLSMLICYLQMRKELDEANRERESVTVDTDEGVDKSVTLTAVYRVALDVMIKRVQSKQQAERHNTEEKVEACKRILEKMAMQMQVQQRSEIGTREVEDLLEDKLKNEWFRLKSAVSAGHAMFLRLQDGQLSFLVKGFQNFFAACKIIRDGGDDLPGLVTLFTEPWWAQMLEMLAESSEHRYVRFIESRLLDFEAIKGETFLHIAARMGHRPIFTSLKLFTQQNQLALLAITSYELHTPLHVAAEKGNAHLCALMLDHKALVDAEDADGCMPMHVAMQNGHFQTAKFLLEKFVESHGGAGRMNGHTNKKGQAEILAAKILSKTQALSEEDFLHAVSETFVELRFFGKSEVTDMKRELGALLAVFWISADHYDQFVRCQPVDARLTKSSWEKLQAWTHNTVGLTKSPATVGAMLVFVAIMRLGNIKAFRRTFAPEFDDPAEALAHILHTTPILIPSFSRLAPNLQQMILSALKADFNFGQFLQAENLPANLFIVKEILGGGEGSVNILGFFLFRIFAAMCGIAAHKTLDGSSFMTDKMYGNYLLGLGVLQHLMEEPAQKVYNRFLEKRAEAQGLTFNENDSESRARVRLACLSRIFDVNGGREITEAFKNMNPQERVSLTRFLNADGITEKPGFLLYNAPELMERARSAVGLQSAMQILLKVYKACSQEYQGSDKQVVSVFVDELVELAKKCTDPEEFVFTKLEVSRTLGRKSDSQGSIKISPWKLVKDVRELEKLTDLSFDLVNDIFNVREQSFLKRAHQVYPELDYFHAEAETHSVYKQTICALLCVYWVISEQTEAFRRGQSSDKKLSDRSWNDIVDLSEFVEEYELLDTIFVAMVIHALGKIPKFKEQLAPNVEGHKKVLRYIMDQCPHVLPSFIRLDENHRRLLRQCLTHDLCFDQFLQAENLPANLTSVKDMFREAKGDEDVMRRMFEFCTFVELAGSLGAESCEGSMYMTEDNFLNFQTGIDVISRLDPKNSESRAYDEYLESRAKGLSLAWDEKNPECRAIVRLAVLSRVNDPFTGIKVSEAFKALSKVERSALTKYLNVDGIKQKPGFILSDAPAFLESAWSNTEVGPESAMRILKRIFEKSEEEYQGAKRSVITIRFGALTKFAKDFFGAVDFQELPFELVKQHSAEALVIPKAWIPVTKAAVLDSLREQGQQLSRDLIKNKITEDQFKARIGRIFPELSYFTASAAVREQTNGAMLAVYWLLSNQYEPFIRGQAEDEHLSRQSWAWIQEWLLNTVKLSSEEAVDATLTFMAIHALGKITEFREELAAGFDAHMHDVALAHVLENHPQVAPSFSRLSPYFQKLIVDSLSVDFQFSQFLSAENVPANLVVVKEKLKPHGDDGFAFFCFRIFAAMCGKLGVKPMTGSLFMTEAQFQRFRPGLDALQQLRTMDAGSAYNTFLLNRGSKALSKFASPEHQALVRLLCLGSAFDYSSGNAVCEAFDELPRAQRAELTRWLTSDGIVSKPGYVLCEVPTLLDNAKANLAVGLNAAFRMLVRVQQECEADVARSKPPSKVVVHVSELASWAKEAGPDVNEFEEARLALKSEYSTESKSFTVEVIRPTSGDRSWNAAHSTAVLDLTQAWSWPWMIGSVLLALMSSLCLAIALGLQWHLDVLRPLRANLGMSPQISIMVFGSLSGLTFMVIAGLCCCHRYRGYTLAPSSCASGVSSCQEVGPREPFLARRGYYQLSELDDAVNACEAVV